MARKTTGSRFNLGEPISGDLADFATAHYGASETEIIRIAVRVFINDRLVAEPEMRKRFEEARHKRLGAAGNVIRLVPSGK